MTAPLTNQELYRYFAGEGIAIGALDPSAVRGSSTIDTDGKIINRGAVKLNHQGGGASSCATYGMTAAHLAKLPPGTERPVDYQFQCATCGAMGWVSALASSLPHRSEQLCGERFDKKHGNEVIIDTHGTAHVRHKRVRYSGFDDDGEWSRELLSL